MQKALDAVVESCVCRVGVDLNTAAPSLLARVAGLSPGLAAAIVEHRAKSGPFRTRRQLLEVPRISDETFAQAAGFLRVRGGEHPLDATGIHPERYGALEAFAAASGKTVGELLGEGAALVRAAASLAEELGAYTCEDVVAELERGGRDPRGPFAPFSFREDVQKLEDVKPGMVCPGVVTNVTAFGAFVDIGAHHDGLVHVSQLGRKFTKEPREVVHPGERLEVRVLKVDLEKKQISLTMRKPPEQRSAPRPARRPETKPARRPEKRPPENRTAPPAAASTKPVEGRSASAAARPAASGPAAAARRAPARRRASRGAAARPARRASRVGPAGRRSPGPARAPPARQAPRHPPRHAAPRVQQPVRGARRPEGPAEEVATRSRPGAGST